MTEKQFNRAVQIKTKLSELKKEKEILTNEQIFVADSNGNDLEETNKLILNTDISEKILKLVDEKIFELEAEFEDL